MYIKLTQKLTLLALPIAFFGISLIMRNHAGPFWLWSNLDPDYAYLFDSLNMVNGNWPQLIVHPGITVDIVGAIVIKTLHPLISTEEINRLVLTNPEFYLTIIGRVLIVLNSVALIVLGAVGYIVFRDLLPAVLLQMGPFLSKLTFKWSLHVAPEPLLITTVICLSIVTILTLKNDQLEEYRHRYAIAFGIICGFGMATKVTSAGIYLLPILILWKLRAIALYGIVSVFAILIFTLPAAGNYHTMIDQLVLISSSTGYHGHGEQGFIDFSSYPSNLLRVSSRPIFFGVLFLGIGLLVTIKIKTKLGKNSNTWRALAGLCLAFCGQAMLVAKHPAGHYMIPALTASSLGLALIYQLFKNLELPTKFGITGLKRVVIIFLIILMGNQANALLKLDKEFSKRVFDANKLDERKYGNCARIYFWPASNPQYGLFFGSWNTKYSFTNELDSFFPNKSIMYLINDRKLHGMKGLYDPKNLATQFPCIYARGERPKFALKMLTNATLAYGIKDNCKSGAETIITWGIKCKNEKE